MIRSAARLVLLSLAFALSTAGLGWWAVPALGLIWGLVDREGRRPGTTAAVAAGLGWAALLLWSGIEGPIGRLATQVGAVMGVPGWALIAATLILPILLAGTAAAVAAKAGRLRLEKGTWRRWHPGAVLVGLVLSGLATRPLPAQGSREAEVRTAVAEFLRRFNGRDVRGVMQLYSGDAGVSTTGDGRLTPGRAAIQRRIEDFYGGAVAFSIRPDSVRVRLIGDRAAVAVFEYTLVVGERPSGAQSPVTTPAPPLAPLTGAMTITFERAGDGWLVVNDHTSSRGDGRADGSTDRPAGQVDRPGAPPRDAVAIPASPAPRPIRPTRPCLVGRISDGDTFVCKDGTKVRLTGVDAPELSQRPYGAQAQEALHALIPVGSEVRLEPDVQATDRNGRTLAYVWRDTVMVNWALVRRGWAMLLTVPPNVNHRGELAEAERRAREARAGLWATGGFSCSPRDRRDGKCD